MSENNLLTREVLMTTRRRRVATSLGSHVIVRALGYSDLVGNLGVLLDLASLGSKDAALPPAELARTQKGAALMAGIEKIIVAAVVEPKFGTDPAAGPVPSDLPPEDQMEIFTVVLELSGYSKEAGNALRPS